MEEMPEKPENSVQFICQNMSGSAHLKQENENLRRQLAEALDGDLTHFPVSIHDRVKIVVDFSPVAQI